MSGMDDLANQAKKAIEQQAREALKSESTTDAILDKVEEFAKDKFGHDDKVESVREMVDNAVGGTEPAAQHPEQVDKPQAPAPAPSTPEPGTPEPSTPEGSDASASGAQQPDGTTPFPGLDATENR